MGPTPLFERYYSKQAVVKKDTHCRGQLALQLHKQTNCQYVWRHRRPKFAIARKVPGWHMRPKPKAEVRWRQIVGVVYVSVCI